MRMRRLLVIPLALVVLGLGTAAVVVQQAGVAPRQLGPYVEKRTSGHNPLIVKGGRWVAATLLALDRGDDGWAPEPALALGAQPQPVGSDSAGKVVLVADLPELRAALARAEPGDAITLLPGTYRIDAPLDLNRPGSAQAPIAVRARRPGSVLLEQAGVEGFRINAPYWHVENLTIRGTCADDTYCEHALHVSGGAHDVVVRNNTLVDFNAHVKINGADGAFPDRGLIESNTLTNTRARRTANPVTPIDLVAASDWIFRRNLISDFVKAEGDGVSYGGFAKGAGARNLFEQNLVWCERRLRGLPGQRVGLSLGGGATGKPYCRDHACVVEQEQGTIRGNLIMGCSDAGIYLNSAARSSVQHNTIIDTTGIDVRFPGTSADVEGNLVDGSIRSRNDGVLRARDNLSAAPLYPYLGYHPVRALFAAPLALDFAWHGEPPRRASAGAVPSLCGEARSAAPAYGAFDDFRSCLSASPAVTSSSSAAN
jgi:parallel beta-helix repeat protein